MSTKRITITPQAYETADADDNQAVDVARIMDDLELPIELEATWDDDEAIARIDVRLAAGSYIALWPANNTPEGVADALADELEHLASEIRKAVRGTLASVA
jgi:hypothetical protein